MHIACHASLVAGHSAMRALRHGECAAHVALGINLMLLHASSAGMAIAGMTSATGRCHTFDDRADGYARGEGCSALVLHNQEEPQKLQLSLRGSAVRQDGRSASLTAPNGLAQQGLLVAARSDASAQALEMHEAHGTGTALGDPIEASSLAAVVQGRNDNPVVGSTKANLGHGESTAGATGLLRLGRGLLGREAGPNAQLRVLNPRVGHSLRGLAFTLPTQLAPFSSGGDGGVSSFGYTARLLAAPSCDSSL